MPTAHAQVQIPQELQDAANKACLPIMAKLKIRGAIAITVDPSPDAPIIIGATPGLGGIAITWQANTENDLAALPYRIYRNSALVGGPQAGTSYTDTSARAGVVYTYGVTATDAAGNESAPGVTIATRPSPPVVLNFTAKITGANVDLSWTASTDPAHATYVLQRSVNGGSFTQIGTPTGTSTTDTGPTANVPLIYRIFDRNNVGDDGAGSDAGPLTIDTLAPDAVANLRITGFTGSSISIAWNASGGAVGYEVARQVNGAGGFTVLVASQAGVTYTDSTATSGNSYTYRVRAFDAVPNYTNGTTVTQAIPALLPAPAHFTPTASTSGIALAWDVVSGATKYLLQRALSATGPWVTIAQPVTNSYNDTAAPVSVTSYYQLCAVDSLNRNGAFATVSAVRPATIGTGYPRVGVGTSAQTAATVTAPKLGHFTHFNARALVPVGIDWRKCKYDWDLGETGTQTVTDPRYAGHTVDLNTDGHAEALMLYTLAGQKNVSVRVTTPAGNVVTGACVVNVPPAGRTVNLVGSSHTYKTMADIDAHMVANSEWALEDGTYTAASDIRMMSNVLIRAINPGNVTIHSTMIGIPIFTGDTTQTKDFTVTGINFTSDYVNTTNGDGTPIKKSQAGLVTEKGENIGFADCTVAIMNECWKGSEVDITVDPPTSYLNGAAHLRCGATDPIGVFGRTFWIEGIDIKNVGCYTLNSMSESPERNANTAAIRAYRAWNDVKQTLDPANHRNGVKACSTNRALKVSTIRCCRYAGGVPGGGDLSFDPHTGDAHDSENLVDSCLIYGQVTIQGNNDHLLLTNNVFDRRGGNFTAIFFSVNTLPIANVEIVGNTMIGNSAHQPFLYVSGSDPASHFVTGLVCANNLMVNPNLVPIAGNSYSNSMTFAKQDIPSVAKIGGNIHPDVHDWQGGRKLVYSGLSTVSPDYMLTLAQFNTAYSASDIQAAVTVNSAFAPGTSSRAATAGITSAAFAVPLRDFYGAARAANLVGACNPV